MRLACVIGLFAWVLLAACDRLPDRGGLNEPCFGNGSCDEGLHCNAGVCSTCTPDCSGKCEGADDTCGGNCSDPCPSGQVCQNQVCVNCTSDCSGKNCGADDGCGKLCSGPCVNDGEYCLEGVCVDCVLDGHCGLSCEDCADNINGTSCVNEGGTQPGDYFCACANDGLCAAGEICDEATGFCVPGDLCAGSVPCFDLVDCAVGEDPNGTLCMDLDGVCGCGCFSEMDCPGLGENRCIDQQCCESLCAGMCDGSQDPGCPNVLCAADSCAPGTSCNGTNCVACESDILCGDLCEDCTQDPTRPTCVDQGGFYECGCDGDDDGDCGLGSCDAGVCVPGTLVYQWTVSEQDGGVTALAITPAGADPSLPVVAVGGAGPSTPHGLRLWALDGDLVPPRLVQTLGASGTVVHDGPIVQLTFAADGDLFSLDENGKWLEWNNATDAWQVTPRDWLAGTSQTVYSVSAGGQDSGMQVAVTTGQFNVEFYDDDQASTCSESRGSAITDLEVKENGFLAVITNFDNQTYPDTYGAVALRLSDCEEFSLQTDNDAYLVALTHGPIGFQAAMVVEGGTSGSEKLVFYETLLTSSPDLLDHSYNLQEPAEDLVLVSGDEWAFVVAEGGRLYAYRTSSSEPSGPYSAYTSAECLEDDTPLLAAAGELLVTACGGIVRVWDVDKLLLDMGVAEP